MQGIKLNALKVPSYEVVGDPVVLHCDYELQDDKLYSVTWYRDNHEFYRYVPNSKPHIKTFELPGIAVNVSSFLF